MILEHTATTLTAFLEKVHDIQRVWNPDPSDPEEVWFRGASKSKHDLLPGLYRDGIPKTMGETNLFLRFKCYSSALLPHPPANEAQWYFLAQHYGLATRLLDWTESALAALYFAVSKALGAISKRDFYQALQTHKTPVFDEESPCVWMLEAGTLNRAAMGPANDAVFVPEDGPILLNFFNTGVSTLTSPTTFEYEGAPVSNEWPVAILPPRSYNNSRIIAQQGTFTIHGTKRCSIQQLPGVTTGSIFLACVRLDRANLAQYMDSLLAAGVNEATLFPELRSIAKHVMWTCE